MPGAEQRPQPGGVAMNTSLPSRVTWHITWDALTNGQQPSFDGVAGYLERMGYCPTLMWDPWTGRIVQFYPADQGGRALVNWNQDGRYNIQIETFFSPGAVRDGVTYATVADTPCVGLAEILAWTDSLGIPRVWPMGAPQWAGNSRDPGIWNSEPGHYGHCNVPDNTHTDPGPMPDITGSLAAKGTTVQEQDMPLSGADHQFILEAIDDYFMNVRRFAGNRNVIDAVNQIRTDIGGLGANLPAQVLNQTFKLADGTVTNLAGILTAIHAQPAAAAGPVTVADPQAIVDAIVNGIQITKK